jgi:competence protein ComEC
MMRVKARLERWGEAERGRAVLFLPVLMATGVLFYNALTVEPPVWLAPVVLAGAAGGAWWLRERLVLRGLALAVAAIALGMTAIGVAASRAPPLAELPRKATIVAGVVASVEPLPNGRRITLLAPQFDGGKLQARRLRIRLRPDDEGDFAPGDRITVRAVLSPPAPPAYPGGWDLQRDAFFSGLGGGGRALGPANLIASAQPQGTAVWVQGLRHAIAGRIRAVLPGSEGAIAATLLVGITSAIPEADRAAYRDSGLAHLLAIAGLHIGIVMGLAFGVTRFSLGLSEHAGLFWPTRNIAAVAALAVGLAYLLLTGGHVPILRSFAMASLVTIGLLAGRRAVSLRGLALAMLALVVFAPSEVMGVSFQMSFSAVLALIVGYDMLRPWLQKLRGDGGRWRRFVSHVVALALTSALAGTASAPYGAYHFGHIQLYYVFANMIAVPITAMLVMPAGMLALALMPLHWEVLALLPMGWGISAITWIGHAVSGWPAAVLAVPHIPPWGLALFSAGLAWFGLWRSRIRMAGIVAMAIGLGSPAVTTPPDLLVSADARLIGLRTASGVVLHKTSGGSRFTQDAWLQHWAETATDALPPCPADGCLLHTAPEVRLLDAALPQAACAAALLVSPAPIRLNCDHKVAQIDRFTVWRDGAHAVWLGRDPPLVLSDRAYRGERPWVPPIPTSGRLPPGPTLPVALTDEG